MKEIAKGRTMLTLEVKGYLADLMDTTFTRSELETLAWKLGVETGGRNKLEMARNLLTRISEQKEAECVRLTVLEAMRREWNRTAIDKLNDLKRALEGTMFHTLDQRGVMMPILDTSTQLRVTEERSRLMDEMKGLGFNLSLEHFKDAVRTYGTSYKGCVSLLRDALEALINGMIERVGQVPSRQPAENRKILVELRLLQDSERQEELRSVDALYGMLSHYGAHPEYVTEDVVNFLLIWTVSFMWFLVKRYHAIASSPLLQTS